MEYTMFHKCWGIAMLSVIILFILGFGFITVREIFRYIISNWKYRRICNSIERFSKPNMRRFL